MSLTAEQLARRRTGITSTDITRIVGESPFGGPADVYLEKISESPPRTSTIPQRIGDFLEPLVCELVAERFRLPELVQGTTVEHPYFTWALTTPDRTFAGGLVEAKAKTLLFTGREQWLDEESPPGHVVVQCQWHLAVTQHPVCHVGALVGAVPMFWTIDRDSAFGSMLLETAQEFHERHVLARVPPKPDGSEGWRRMAAAVWPRATKGSAVAATRQAEVAAQMYFLASERMKRAEAAKEFAAQELIAFAADNERVNGDGWRLVLSERAAVEIPATTRKSYRHFDLRPSKGG